MAISITGKLEASAGKGAFKLTWPEELDAGAIDVLITMAAGGKISATGTTGEIIVQTGAGAPVHSATEGTPYWDTTGDTLYVNNNGSTGWTAWPGGGSSSGDDAKFILAGQVFGD